MILQMPVRGGRLTDPFGPRGVVPGLGDLGTHTGQDIAANGGTPVYAVAAGVVSRVWWDAFANGAGAGGWMIQVDHEDGYQTRYAHLIRRPEIAIGARVSTNTVIGQLGMSGAATGFHLHLELLRNGVFLDPMKYMRDHLPEVAEESEDEMSKNHYIAKIVKGKQTNAIFNTVSGFCHQFESSSGSYNTNIAKTFDVVGPSSIVSESHYDALVRDCANTRQGK